MSRRLLWAGFALSVVAATGVATLQAWPLPTPRQISADAGDVNRGAYLARMAGCIACHTDVAGGGKPLAGGVPLKTKFGTFYAPNITTDEKHGIGGWTLEQFAEAVRNGVSPDGESYYPAFPYLFYSKLSDQDVADLWAAFRTVPPVGEASTPQDLVFPFNLRSGLKLWRSAFQTDEGYTPAPRQERGLEPRGLYRRGASSLRRLSHAAKPGGRQGHRVRLAWRGRKCPMAASRRRSPQMPC